MFRLDGEVFLLGTAIPAPSKFSNKNCDDLRLLGGANPRRRPDHREPGAPIAKREASARRAPSRLAAGDPTEVISAADRRCPIGMPRRAGHREDARRAIDRSGRSDLPAGIADAPDRASDHGIGKRELRSGRRRRSGFHYRLLGLELALLLFEQGDFRFLLLRQGDLRWRTRSRRSRRSGLTSY